MRGYFGVGLVNPKSAVNVGSVLRAAHCFSAAFIHVTGQRFKRLKQNPTDTMKSWKHLPVTELDDIFDALPHSCVPIAVDLLPDALPLPKFKHPERAFYIFGAEDATLGKAVTSRCKYSIVIPSKYCLNLAAAVNVILYDRISKYKKL